MKAHIGPTVRFSSLSLSLLNLRLSYDKLCLFCELGKGIVIRVFYNFCPLFLNSGFALIVSEMRGFFCNQITVPTALARELVTS